ncbi:hypothetical protein [Streptomyces sp. NPDC059398]|uniref:hypothetical protein n=1 Tax=Streptomyces sp. NPDC059398 TaxID=3346820 RepID=UPI0036B5691E
MTLWMAAGVPYVGDGRREMAAGLPYVRNPRHEVAAGRHCGGVRRPDRCWWRSRSA